MIRKIKKSDVKEIAGWWHFYNGQRPPDQAIPSDTYIMEYSDGRPWICISLMHVNHPEFCWTMGLCSNPEIEDDGRKSAVNELWEYVCGQAKEMDYENVFCVAPSESLKDRYEELGFKVTHANTFLMMKSLRG